MTMASVVSQLRESFDGMVSDSSSITVVSGKEAQQQDGQQQQGWEKTGQQEEEIS
jgi:hypothetical protein